MTKTPYTAADFTDFSRDHARALAPIILAALRIAERVMTPDYIAEAIAQFNGFILASHPDEFGPGKFELCMGFRDEAEAIRAALTAEEE